MPDFHFPSKTLNILKAALPFMPSGMQAAMSNFVKIEEFNNMFMNLNNSLDSTISACGLPEHASQPFNMSDFICAVKPYLNKNEQELLNMFVNMTNAFNIYSMYQTLPDNMKPNNNYHDNGVSHQKPQSDNAAPPNNINIEALKNLLSPEQKNMFDKYSALLNNQPPKGGNNPNLPEQP